MSAFKLSLLTLAATAVLTRASLRPASAQVLVISHTQSPGGAMKVGYWDRYGYGYRPYYRRYGYYRPPLPTLLWLSARPRNVFGVAQ